MFDEEKFNVFLDTRGLNCPLPILKTKKALSTMTGGQSIHVVATDSGAVDDFRAFSVQTGHPLVKSWEREDEFHFVLEKSEK